VADVQLPTRFPATHDTLGGPWVPWLPGPDAEDIMAAPGTGIDAPAAGRITRLSGRDPSLPPPQGVGGPWGLSLYFVTAAGDAFYGTHLSSVAPVGSYAKGQRIGTVGDYPGLAADHVHWAFVGNVSDPRVAGLVGGGSGQVPAMSNAQSKASQDVVHEILQRSLEKGASDIQALLAVASVEGGFDPSSPPGDQGTSFGPFQLHKGGALPAGIADPQRWAWSKPGIDYAVDRAVAAEQGASGHAAIANIVRGFEHPKDPTAEIARASTIYDSGSISVHGTGPGSTGQNSVLDTAGNAVTAPLRFAEKVFGTIFSIRGLQVAGGALLVILGVLWLARSSGRDVRPPVGGFG
jgi:hypothetical protein